MISESTIERIRDLDIEEVIGTYITIKKHEACCPFHGEKTPSFKTNSKRNIFKCFGCGISGDAIKFVMEHERLNFSDAVIAIAEKHGVKVEYIHEESPEERQVRLSKTDEARALLEFAHKYYRKAILSAPEAKAYLHDRGITDEIIDQEEIGFAPDDWQNITKQVIERGWYDVAIEIGLIATTNGRNFDTYRNRIIIPIRDRVGQLVGFGGRALGNDKPKYINPIESFLYTKSSLLYGLDHATKAIKEHNKAILVEGYFDVISLRINGVENIVATCGTAFTEQHAQVLKRHTHNLAIMYDPDAAGIKALEKTIRATLKLGFTVMCIILDGLDPDEFARKHIANG
jgi:DNA primase